MKNRARTHLALAIILVFAGGILIFLSTVYPALGGCITYTNGAVSCTTSPNAILVFLGLILLFLGFVEAFFALKARVKVEGFNRAAL